MRVICTQAGNAELTLNQNYLVYALSFWKERLYYYIIAQDRPIPYPYLVEFFSVVDPSLSRYWVFGIQNLDGSTKASLPESKGFSFTLAYPEWAQNSDYYWELFDSPWNANFSSEFKVFENYKLLLELEYKDTNISVYAQNLVDGWISCPFCEEAWQQNPLDAMARCPACYKRAHNPIYQPVLPALFLPFPQRI